MATFDDEGAVSIWSIPSCELQGRCEWKSTNHEGSDPQLEFSPKGDRLAILRDADVRLWSLDPAESPKHLYLNLDGGILRFTPDGRGLLLFAERPPRVRILSLDTGEATGLLNGPKGEWEEDEFTSVSLSRDGTRLAAGTLRSGIAVWSMPEGKFLWGTGPGLPSRVLLSPDGFCLMAAGSDLNVRLWCEEGHLFRTLTEHRNNISALGFVPPDDLLVSSSWDGTLRLWRLPEGNSCGVLDEGSHVYSLSIHEGAGLLAAGCGTHFSIWGRSAETWSRWTTVSTLHEDDAERVCRADVVAFQPGGNLLAVAGEDFLVRFWRLKLPSAGRPGVRSFRGHALCRVSPSSPIPHDPLSPLRSWADDCRVHLELGSGMITAALGLAKPDPEAVQWALHFAQGGDSGARVRQAAWAELKSCFEGLERLLDEYVGPRPAAGPPPAQPVPWSPGIESLRRVAVGVHDHFELIREVTEQPHPAEALRTRLAENASSIRSALSTLNDPGTLEAAVKALAAYLTGTLPAV